MVVKSTGRKWASCRLGKLVYMSLVAGAVAFVLLLLKFQSENKKGLRNEVTGSGHRVPEEILRGPGHTAVSHSPKSGAVERSHAASTKGSRYRVTAGVTGKLGNQMFQYASLLGIAAMNGRTPFYASPLLGNVFNVSHVHPAWSSKGVLVVNEKDFSTYDPSMESLPPGDTLIMQYFQSWKYFRLIPDTVRREFAFADRFRTAARRMLDKYSAQFPGKRTRVGVHVRRGDMYFPTQRLKGYYTAPVSYLLGAMEYMRGKHADAVFFVVTDDARWCQGNLKAPDLVQVEQTVAEVHLALLASCDHVIMTVGTFGWWGGYLSGGEVVYYWDPTLLVHKPPLPVDIKHPEDFFLPHWVPLSGL